MAFLRPSKPWFGLRGKWLTFWIVVACSADMTLYGYDQGVFSGVVISQDFLQLHGLEGPTKTTLLGTVTAIYDVGCFLGSLLAYWLGEKLGRKKTIIVGTITMTIGALLQCSSYSLGQMMAGRIIAGIGNGLNTSTAPIWQVETSQVSNRGKLVILENAVVLCGFSLANWLNYGMSFVAGPASWRFPLSFQFIFNIAIIATVPWLPESPRWLVSHNRQGEAVQIIADLEDKDTNDSFVQLQMSEIKYTVEYERANGVSFMDLLRGKANDKAGTKTVRRILLGITCQSYQQLCGINVTSYYLPTVLKTSVGLSDTLARLLTAVNSVQYLCWSMLGIPLVAWLCQDIWAAFREKRKTLTFFVPQKPLSALSPHELATRSIYITAKVISYCAEQAVEENFRSRIDDAMVLHTMLDDWRRHLTLEFSPLPLGPRDEFDSYYQPIYIRPAPFAVAVQFFSVSYILLLSHEPTLGGFDQYLERQSIIKRCVEDICGIATTLKDAASSLMSSQALFVAGMFCDERQGREAILELLELCRNRTGWPVRPLGDELQQIWKSQTKPGNILS